MAAVSARERISRLTNALDRAAPVSQPTITILEFPTDAEIAAAEAAAGPHDVVIVVRCEDPADDAGQRGLSPLFQLRR